MTVGEAIGLALAWGIFATMLAIPLALAFYAGRRFERWTRERALEGELARMIRTDPIHWPPLPSELSPRQVVAGRRIGLLPRWRP